MPSREEYLKWARETGTPYVNRHYPGVTSFGFTEETLEALCNRVWNEAIEAAAERLEEQHPWLTKVAASQLVRKLKEGETK